MFTLYKDVQRAVRDDRWKLICYPQINYYQLFDLETDPNEMQNLWESSQYVDKGKEMIALLKEAQKEAGDSCPLTTATPQERLWSPANPKVR
jgi:arylsulfatase A-like enzyme